MKSSGGKPKRGSQACDVCRKRKIRCEGSVSDVRCLNCTTGGFQCTKAEVVKKRGPPKGYVESLEARLDKMGKLLATLYPETDFTREIAAILDKANRAAEAKQAGTSSSSSQHTTPEGTGGTGGNHPSSSYIPPPLSLQAIGAPVKEEDGEPGPTQGIRPVQWNVSFWAGSPRLYFDIEPQITTRTNTVPAALFEEDDVVAGRLAESMGHMALVPAHNRFFGKASVLVLIKVALEKRTAYLGKPAHRPLMAYKREEVWETRPWATPRLPKQHYVYPPPDLTPLLIDLYFTHVNFFTPLLHRPTFERAVRSGLHTNNDSFGAVLLLVCAIASQYSDDSRVCVPGEGKISSGWFWYRQVNVMRDPMLTTPPSLHELQAYGLAVRFLQVGGLTQHAWTVAAAGVRLAIEVGSHRHNIQTEKAITVESELMKRAFWVLLSQDRQLSEGLGRPPSLQEEEYDVSYPLLVDDEHWEIRELGFKQPPGKPSSVAYFNQYLKLDQIMALTLRTIYSINKARALYGFVGPEWQEKIVDELDKALERWHANVPEHLRWDTAKDDLQWCQQSGSLHIAYHSIRALVHRSCLYPASPLSETAWVQVGEATHQTAEIVRVLRQRKVQWYLGVSLVFQASDMLSLLFTGLVLMLRIFDGQDAQEIMVDVHAIMGAFQDCEERWDIAARNWDFLYDAASMDSRLPLPPHPSFAKRKRTAEELMYPVQGSHSQSPSMVRNIARSLRSTSSQADHTHTSHPCLPGPSQPMQDPVDAVHGMPDFFFGWQQPPPGSNNGFSPMGNVLYEQMSTLGEDRDERQYAHGHLRPTPEFGDWPDVVPTRPTTESACRSYPRAGGQWDAEPSDTPAYYEGVGGRGW